MASAGARVYSGVWGGAPSRVQVRTPDQESVEALLIRGSESYIHSIFMNIAESYIHFSVQTRGKFPKESVFCKLI